MVFKKLTLFALVLAAQTFAAPANLSWNELVMSKHAIFSNEFDSIRSKSLDTTALVAELKNVLENEEIFNSVYRNYLVNYQRDINRFGSAESRGNFKQALLEIAEHNLEAKKGRKTWTQGVNMFADMSDAEASMYANTVKKPLANTTEEATSELKEFPQVNWKSFDSPIKSQGSDCGCCYAFASIAHVENVYNQNNGVVLDLSEQQIVDCSTKTNGCKGGASKEALKYLFDGVTTEDAYPYTGKTGTCQSWSPAGPKVLTYKQLVDEDKMQSGLPKGPINAPIDVDKAFQRYTGGIVTECAGPIIGAHSVVIVATGTENGVDYYDCKNSWGDDKGEAGYWRIKAGGRVCDIGFYGELITTN